MEGGSHSNMFFYGLMIRPLCTVCEKHNFRCPDYTVLKHEQGNERLGEPKGRLDDSTTNHLFSCTDFCPNPNQLDQH